MWCWFLWRGRELPAGISDTNGILAAPIRAFRSNHRAISIIRGRGHPDKNAMDYLLQRYGPEQLQFIDGWTGKGAILRELKQDLQAFPGVSDRLAVIAVTGSHHRFVRHVFGSVDSQFLLE